MTDERRQRALEETLEKHYEEGSKAQADALEEAYLVTDPSQETADRLWLLLVGGLLAMLLIGLVGLILLVALDKSYEVVLTAFAALLSGLLGLFVNAPGSGRDGD